MLETVLMNVNRCVMLWLSEDQYFVGVSRLSCQGPEFEMKKIHIHIKGMVHGECSFDDFHIRIARFGSIRIFDDE
jgi:hypothetical protein